MSAATVRHRCLIYEGSPAVHLQGLASLFRRHLEENRRCLYLNTPEMVGEFSRSFARGGVDLGEQIRRGALILSSDQSHLQDGIFDSARMLRILEDSVQQALKDGFTGLFASGDMTFEFGPEKNFSKLIEYELGLDELFQKYPMLYGVCQYHRDTLEPDQAVSALQTHRAVYHNDTLPLLNPWYSPAPITPRARATAAGVSHMLAHLTPSADL